MNIALWILQVLVGAFFVYHMTLMYRPQAGMVYMREMQPGLRIFAGLVRPVAWLVTLAAAGLVVLMLGAIVFHLRRHEYPNIGLNAVLLLLSGFIAYGRGV